VVCPNQPLDLTSFIDWDGIALPDDLVEIAAKEINETPETREHGLIALQELIASLPEGICLSLQRSSSPRISVQFTYCHFQTRDPMARTHPLGL
jgi:hypothetical protein